MSTPVLKVTHTPKGGAAVNYTNVQQVNVRTNIGGKIGDFDFTIPNYNGAYSGTFSPDDDLDISFGYTTANEKVFSGRIAELHSGYSQGGGDVLKVAGTDRLSWILNMIDSKDYPIAGANNTSSKIIKDVISRMNDNIGAAAITTNNVSATTGSFNYMYSFKPVIEVIEELSQHEYTNNGRYIYYLDSGNDLHWGPKPQQTSSTPTLDEDDYQRADIEKSTFDVVNALIIEAGKDNAGHGIFVMSVNYTSAFEVGLKWKYENMAYIATDLINAGSPWNTDDTKLKAEVRTRAQSIGDDLVARLGEPRYRGEVLLTSGTTNIVRGDLVNFVYTPLGWTSTTPKLLRVTDVNHTFNMRGWNTNIVVKEDERALVGT